MTLEKLEEFLLKEGFDPETAKHSWFEAYKAGVAEIELDITGDFKAIRVISLKEDDILEVLG